MKSIDDEVLKNCFYSALIQPSDHWRLQLVQPDIQILTKSPLIVSESSRTPGRNLFSLLITRMNSGRRKQPIINTVVL